MNLKAILALCVILYGSQPVQAQFDYTVNPDNTITITGYSVPGGPVGSLTIPTNISGLTVTSIGERAFFVCNSLTCVTIPGSVTNIGDDAFEEDTSLTSVSIPGSGTSIGYDTFLLCSALTSVTMANGITYIGEGAFAQCTSLTSVTIPGSVTNIGEDAFVSCSALTSVYFQGNAPAADSTVFANDNNPTVYYLPGTTGWSSPFASRQALLWNPLIQTSGTNFGVQSNQFGFKITGTPHISIVVEGCTNLTSPVWTPLQTFTFTGGLVYFSEPFLPNSPGRFYRISPP